MRHCAGGERGEKSARREAVAGRSICPREGGRGLAGRRRHCRIQTGDDLEPFAPATAKAASQAPGDSQVRRSRAREGADAGTAQGIYHGPRTREGAAWTLPREETVRQARNTEEGRRQARYGSGD